MSTAPKETDKRWHATVAYYCEDGIADVEYWVDRLSDLDEILGRGPSFRAIACVHIVHNIPASDAINLEDTLYQ